MMSGDAPRCIYEVSRKKTTKKNSSLKLLCNISQIPPHGECQISPLQIQISPVSGGCDLVHGESQISPLQRQISPLRSQISPLQSQNCWSTFKVLCNSPVSLRQGVVLNIKTIFYLFFEILHYPKLHCNLFQIQIIQVNTCGVAGSLSGSELGYFMIPVHSPMS